MVMKAALRVGGGVELSSDMESDTTIGVTARRTRVIPMRARVWRHRLAQRLRGPRREMAPQGLADKVAFVWKVGRQALRHVQTARVHRWLAVRLSQPRCC